MLHKHFVQLNLGRQRVLASCVFWCSAMTIFLPSCCAAVLEWTVRIIKFLFQRNIFFELLSQLDVHNTGWPSLYSFSCYDPPEDGRGRLRRLIHSCPAASSVHSSTAWCWQQNCCVRHVLEELAKCFPVECPPKFRRVRVLPRILRSCSCNSSNIVFFAGDQRGTTVSPAAIANFKSLLILHLRVCSASSSSCC